mgnify:CR=1
METVLQMIPEVGEALLLVVILAALLEWSQIVFRWRLSLAVLVLDS